MNDTIQVIRQMQLQKVIGELEVLKTSYYDPMGRDMERYAEVKNIVDEMIKNLKDYF